MLLDDSGRHRAGPAAVALLDELVREPLQLLGVGLLRHLLPAEQHRLHVLLRQHLLRHTPALGRAAPARPRRPRRLRRHRRRRVSGSCASRPRLAKSPGEHGEKQRRTVTLHWRVEMVTRDSPECGCSCLSYYVRTPWPRPDPPGAPSGQMRERVRLQRRSSTKNKMQMQGWTTKRLVRACA
jgi:hypothetical protein